MTPQTGEVVTRPAAILLLWACLAKAAAEGGQPSHWHEQDWLALVATLTPPEIAAVALKMTGATNARAGAWLGVSRGRADQHWQKALRKMRKVAEGGDAFAATAARGRTRRDSRRAKRAA